jgi:hypothetical protein
MTSLPGAIGTATLPALAVWQEYPCITGGTPSTAAFADQAVYTAKANGRDRVVGSVFSGRLQVLKAVA